MQDIFSYIAACPTPYHAVSHTEEKLKNYSYIKLSETEDWNLQQGKGYYTIRNGSSLIAFRIPNKQPTGFMIAACHGDTPCFKIKENAGLSGSGCVRLATEKYGGMIYSTWLDRPLSIAGRVVVRDGNGVRTCLVDFKEPCAVIPNVAIHLNRQLNDKCTYNPAADLLPVYALGEDREIFSRQLAEYLGIEADDILSTDLYLYNPQAGTQWNDIITAPRLDDLQCAYGTLTAFLAAKESRAIPVYCLFDNEEVGSQTKQGAASTFLFDVLTGICGGLAQPVRLPQLLPTSFMVSCDNAHGMHPNHPELSDPNHAPKLGQGIVIKYNAAQHYTTDAVSSALFQLICKEADVSWQRYNNRADLPGGSTLGNIANTQVSLNTVDIGCPQLAMHSAYETASASDTAAFIKALTVFYGKALQADGNGGYTLI